MTGIVPNDVFLRIPQGDTIAQSVKAILLLLPGVFFALLLAVLLLSCQSFGGHHWENLWMWCCCFWSLSQNLVSSIYQLRLSASLSVTYSCLVLQTFHNLALLTSEFLEVTIFTLNIKVKWVARLHLRVFLFWFQLINKIEKSKSVYWQNFKENSKEKLDSDVTHLLYTCCRTIYSFIIAFNKNFISML